MAQGGDRGKSPNVTGTQPKPKIKKSPNQAGERAVQRGARQGTGRVMQAGPKKVAARSTKRSRDR
ncbi:MAG TPA: hypothetical protein VJ751_07900 [Pyrinomonadaceae bacterium]|jgi:hypothetical protein|nr:hypothetical protein [Pyrinomonadaceae bacterium]